MNILIIVQTAIRHKKNAHMANDFSCEDCDVSFGRSESLSRHVKSVHDGKKTYSCPYCEKQLGRTILIFSEGSQTSKKFECEICGKECAKKCELKRHILSVHNEHSSHCSQCDLKFGTKVAMIRHKKNAHMANDFM